METQKVLRYISMITGIIVTFLLLLVFLPSYIGLITEKGFSVTIRTIIKSFIEFNDDPSAFFITYLVGYVIVWWKPLWGSIIIMFGCIFYFILVQNIWCSAFVLPALIVGVLYFNYRWSIRLKST